MAPHQKFGTARQEKRPKKDKFGKNDQFTFAVGSPIILISRLWDVLFISQPKLKNNKVSLLRETLKNLTFRRPPKSEKMS